MNTRNAEQPTSFVDQAAVKIFEELAGSFPVCMASDEFHFFPQYKSKNPDWTRWDDFSFANINRVCRQLSQWDQELEDFAGNEITGQDEADLHMLRHSIRVVSEQLQEVWTHEFQPTFYLTILSIGLSEAVEAGHEALAGRIKAVPEFLSTAQRNLQKIPLRFCVMGIQMIEEARNWIQTLPAADALTSIALKALDRFECHLNSVVTLPGFLLPLDLYRRIAGFHMQCFADIDEISDEIDREIRESRKILESTAKEMGSDLTWKAVFRTFDKPKSMTGGTSDIYEKAISDLAAHCVEKGIVSQDQVLKCPVRVEPIPDYLMPVRNNAAYSIQPEHPPSGGVFYMMESEDLDSVDPDYRLLTAHETYPGHHLLDTCRWNQQRTVRRHLEFPLFYEGWACFAEELMFETGFFSTRQDQFLLAKRRYWRAVRGRLDLDIHTGKKMPEEAASYLAPSLSSLDEAKSKINKYILKPGYQLSYAVGRRKFKRLYDRYMKKNSSPADFAVNVLSLGEIGFHHLEKILLKQ